MSLPSMAGRAQSRLKLGLNDYTVTLGRSGIDLSMTGRLLRNAFSSRRTPATCRFMGKHYAERLLSPPIENRTLPIRLRLTWNSLLICILIWKRCSVLRTWRFVFGYFASRVRRIRQTAAVCENHSLRHARAVFGRNYYTDLIRTHRRSDAGIPVSRFRQTKG
jgi:hypothetical protein